MSYRFRSWPLLGAAAVVLLLLSACGRLGPASGPLPPHPGEEGDRSVEGVDSNGNGVRDDVEIFLARKYGSDPELLEALTHVAIATQDVLVGAAEGREEGEQIDALTRMLEYDACTVALRGFDASLAANDALLDAVVNTDARIDAYYEAERLMEGRLLRYPDDPAAACPTSELAALARGANATRPATIGAMAACRAPQVTNIYFANGVRTSVKGAWDAVTAIEKKLGHLWADREAAGEVYTLSLAYNHSYGWLGWRDFQEVFRQKAREQNGWTSLTDAEIKRMQFQLENLSDPANSDPSSRAADPRARAAYQAALGDTVVRSLAELTPEYYISGTASNHVLKYRSDLMRGERVIVVAHSQGNLFALHAYEYLAEDQLGSMFIDGMDVLGVATPASRAPGSGRYVTESSDSIIAAASLAFPSVLPRNVTNWMIPPGGLRHLFASFYMKNRTATLPAIEGILADQIKNLPFPSGTLSTGPITVVLEWDEQPDVDLHISEPNGAHVYWANRNGPSGYLDRDDRNGYGPEHYYVSCETLELGTYTIGVNYYSGFAPTDVRLQVSTDFGAKVENIERRLTEARGSSGVSDPIILAYVHVGGTPQNPTFTIRRAGSTGGGGGGGGSW